MPCTVAQRYNEAAARLMPHMVSDLHVDPSIAFANKIDDAVFRRSENNCGTAAVLLSILAGEKLGAHYCITKCITLRQ